jgi:hypothetical protein
MAAANDDAGMGLSSGRNVLRFLSVSVEDPSLWQAASMEDAAALSRDTGEAGNGEKPRERSRGDVVVPGESSASGVHRRNESLSSPPPPEADELKGVSVTAVVVVVAAAGVVGALLTGAAAAAAAAPPSFSPNGCRGRTHARIVSSSMSLFVTSSPLFGFHAARRVSSSSLLFSSDPLPSFFGSASSSAPAS